MEDLLLAIQNIIRLGTISEVSYTEPPRVRVSTGELTTNWLPWVTLRAGETKTWSPPTIGEQVILLSPGGDLTGAFAMMGIYSDANSSPSLEQNKHVTTYPDGAKVEYDHATSTMVVSGIKNLTITASEEVTINSPLVSINGVLAQTAGYASLSVDELTINGNVTQSGGSLISNGVVLHTHTHKDVTPGSSNTGEPT